MPVHAAVRCKTHEVFEHQPDLVLGQLIIAMAALFALGQETPCLELGKMGTRRLQCDARMSGKLGRRQCPATHQGSQHVGAGRVADQRADESDVWTFFHTSMVVEASMAGKRP